MRSVAILAVAAGFSGVRAATAPLCKACEQNDCLDSIIKEECGEYLVIVETPATSTVVETVLATVVPTVTHLVSVSTTAVNNATTTVHVSASQTVDYTVTLTESETETDTVTETETETDTITETATTVVTSVATVTLPPLVRRHGHVVDRFGYDVPEYAVCEDIYEYSSACDCVGFVPSTSTAPAPSTTETVTETVTPSTAFVTETIATLSFTRNATTIPVTATATTVTVSRAVDTVTDTTVVATTTATETETETTTTTTTTTETETLSRIETVSPTEEAPRPTYTAKISGPGGIQIENINVPPGAHIGVIATIRQTTNPATLVITPDGMTTYYQVPAIHVPYSFYHYMTTASYSYVQVTSALVAGIMGVRPLNCKVGADQSYTCQFNGSEGELWICGRHLAIVAVGQSGAFQSTCATPIIRGTLQAEILGTTY